MPLDEGFAVTGLAGVFPGAADLEAFWTRVLAADPAHPTSLSERWGIARDRYMGEVGAPNRIYVDLAFALPWAEIPRLHDDLQVSVARHVAARALASVTGAALDPASTALVLATSWTAPSYFAAHAEASLGRAAAPSSEPPVDPGRQLALIAAELGGPRIAVDTACASSLYGLDAAMRIIESGQAEAALVLGLNAVLTPFLYVGFSKLRALSPEGRILPFSAGGSGIVPGEAAGAIVIERASHARAHGRRVRALVRSIGLSSDGTERSVFAPGERGQKQAYARAWDSLDPSEIDYVEAHGTATPIGDETEITTLQEFFGTRRDRPLPIGSVKGLVGHTLAAAGIASLTKCILMLERDVVPPHLAVDPHAKLAGTRLELTGSARAFGTRDRPTRIGISSFGFGGSNAHVVLESVANDVVPARSAPSAAPATRSGPSPALAVIDAAVTLGSAASLEEIATVIRGGTLASRRLAAERTIEATGLRMGPNLLRRLDPLQLLLAASARDLLERLPARADPDRAAIVVVCNLGGDTCLRLSLRDRSFSPTDELHVETIASSLPSMASGYPAHQLDLRAFHETFAGGAGTFASLLRAAPGWLDGACDLLVLGAARTVKSPLEDGTDEGEGFGLLLLSTIERAKANGWPVRATIAAAEPGRGAAIDADALTRTFGRLGEASGLECLAAALAGTARTTRLELDGGASLIIDRQDGFEVAAVRSIKLPLTVSFAGRSPTSPPSPRPDPPTTSKPPPRTKSGATELLLRSIRASEDATRAVFAGQREAGALLGASAAPATPPPTARASVLADTTTTPSGARARLVVDDRHPYFFDHALDHVPGILLAAGACELSDRWAEGASETCVTELVLQFRRFCEKDRAIELSLGGSAGAARGKVVQDGHEIASVEIRRAAAPRERAVSSPSPLSRVAAQLVHKERAENVLVSPLDAANECILHPPPVGHFLTSGSATAVGAPYLLEASRQVVMLGAHTVMGIPLGMPMNLLRIALSLKRPIALGEPLTGKLVLGSKHDIEGMVLADVTVELRCRGEALGALAVKAQVVDRATYEAQRGKR